MCGFFFIVNLLILKFYLLICFFLILKGIGFIENIIRKLFVYFKKIFVFYVLIV